MTTKIQQSASDFFCIAYSGTFLEARPDGTVAFPMSTSEKIDSFAELDLGWDYGDGGPVAEPVIEAAHTWNRLLNLIGFDTDASPGGEGEVAVGASCGPFYLEVTVESDQSTSVAYDMGGQQQFYRLNQPSINALSSILDATGAIWNAYTSFTQRNTTPQNVSGIGTLLRTIKDHSQSSWLNALPNQGSANADTFANTGVSLNTSAATHLSSGGLMPLNYPMVLRSALAAPNTNVIISSKG